MKKALLLHAMFFVTLNFAHAKSTITTGKVLPGRSAVKSVAVGGGVVVAGSV